MDINSIFKKTTKLAMLILCFALSNSFIYAQESKNYSSDFNLLDEKTLYKKLEASNTPTNEIKGIIQTIRQEHSSKKALLASEHKHSSNEVNTEVQERIIYLNPNSPSSIGCPNSGFEQYNFANWTGNYGTYSGDQSLVTYNLNNGIINPAGPNISLQNTSNYHTLLTIPPTNSVYPNCVGYDSIAARVVGSQTVSEIPFVSPYSLDGVSCRMLGAYGSGGVNGKVAKLKYIMSVTPTTKLFSYSYAVVLNDGHSSDPTTHQPYFKVTVKDQNGNSILACQDFNQDATSAISNPDFKTSHLTYGGYPIVYKPWSLVSIDLSSPIYSSITSISIEFEVAGCTAGGHLGYAYVDAECGRGGINTAFCGSSNASLVAPYGYSNYQWIDPTGNPIPAPAGTTNTLNLSSPLAGQVYTVNMNTPGGCSVSLTQTIQPTSVSIVNVNSAPSCAGGNSGSAVVVASGSSSGYTYTWTATSGPNTGSVVGTTQTVNNLPPGTYSVVVASTNCGQASANLSVGTTPPNFLSLLKTYCGSAALISNPGGSNYQWYYGSGSSAVLIPAPNGTDDSLYISNPSNGATYTLVYKTAAGCKDSIKYTLGQIIGGSSYVSNIVSVCPNDTIGSAVINLNTGASAPYTYSIFDSGNVLIANTSTSSNTYSINNLPAGIYTASINDGQCLYSNTFTINTIQTNFTITPTSTVLCSPSGSSQLNLAFGAYAPSSCGLASTDACVNSNTIQIGSGTNVNGSSSYPAIYSNWYKNARHQILYKASELIAAGIKPGKITSLAFNITTINGTTSYPNFTIKMKCTNVQDLNSTSFDNSGLTQVYFISSANITTGWNIYNFPVAYEWDGVSNILIDVCSALTPSYTNNSSSPYTTTPFVSVRYFNSDITTACMTSSSASTSSNRPNILFGNCENADASSYTVSVSSNAQLLNNYSNDSIVVSPTNPLTPGTSIIYTITAINPVGNCSASHTVAILYPVTQPTITASVSSNSVCIGSSITLSATGGTFYNWQQLNSGTLTPIATGSVINTTPANSGINTYVVSGLGLCSSATDTKTVTVDVIPKATLTINGLNDFSKCLNTDAVINSSITTSNPNIATNYTYTWTTLPGNVPAPGTNSLSSYTVSGNSTATLVLSVDGFCANPTSNTITVGNFPNNLTVSITDSVFGCANTPFNLNTSVSGGRPNYSYSWFIIPDINSIGSSSQLSYNFPEKEGTYTISVVVNDSCGYSSSDNQPITVLPPCTLVIPNVITPNFDGKNEIFKIKNLEFFPNTTLTIFDRWGRKIYEKTNYDNSWKADGVVDGTYFYTLIVPNDKTYTGFITVLTNK